MHGQQNIKNYKHYTKSWPCLLLHSDFRFVNPTWFARPLIVWWAEDKGPTTRKFIKSDQRFCINDVLQKQL